MTARSPVGGRAARLAGRRSECEVLDHLVDAVRVGESRTLVLCGEPGAGKTALLDYVAGAAPGCRVVRAAGVQSELELAYAGLQQISAPMLDHVDELPVPQRDALRTAFGVSAGPAPDRFLVGLAALSLLAEVAAERPLVCLVDDQQWLDHASAQALGFVARRLEAESVALVFAARQPTDDVAGLPKLMVGSLPEADARALLDEVLTGPLDPRVRAQIVTETRGNPLALLELVRGLTPAELAGGFGLPGRAPLTGSLEESFRRRAEALPAKTRLLLLVAAADPTGDPVLVWRAAGRLGIGAEAATPAAEAGLLEFGTWVRFRHPLVRSATYRWASPQQRQDVHRALAAATDPGIDPERRAWHRAQARPGQTSRSPPSSSSRLAGRRRAAEWPPLPRSSSARQRSRPSPASAGSGCSRRPGPNATRALWMQRWDCWSRSKRGRWTRCGPPSWSACADRSPTTSAASPTLPGCSSARPGVSSH